MKSANSLSSSGMSALIKVVALILVSGIATCFAFTFEDTPFLYVAIVCVILPLMAIPLVLLPLMKDARSSH